MALRDMLRALGSDGLPARIDLDGETFRLENTFKHNSIAAVGVYSSGRDRVVLKCFRRAALLGLPMAWLGALMARHESTVLRAVQDIRGVPALRGRHGRTGLVRDYVPGRPLTPDVHVEKDFFRELFQLLLRLHRRGIAYVDLEKPENILIGEDGLPYLIDFQVAFHVPGRLLGNTVAFRWLRGQLQRADIYHARKHLRRLLRDRLTPRQVERLRARPRFVQISNLVNAPYKALRRCIFGRS